MLSLGFREFLPSHSHSLRLYSYSGGNVKHVDGTTRYVYPCYTNGQPIDDGYWYQDIHINPVLSTSATGEFRYGGKGNEITTINLSSVGNTGSTGSGGSIDIRPRWYALCYIMKL